jgi:hypothetical protein
MYTPEIDFTRYERPSKPILRVTQTEVAHIFEIPQLSELFPSKQHTISLLADTTAIVYKITDRSGFPWLTYKLRDRRYDGPNWFPTPLTNQWGYHEDEDRMQLRAVETSKYWGDPRFPLTDYFPDYLASFIQNPFAALPIEKPNEKNLQNWLTNWKEVYTADHEIYPGQFSLYKISGLNRHVFESNCDLLPRYGYQQLTAVPTWYHVAKINEHFGFRYAQPDDASAMSLLDTAVGTFGQRASWVVMLQFWAELTESAGLLPETMIDSEFILRHEGKIVTYPLRPDHNVWQIYDLNSIT